MRRPGDSKPEPEGGRAAERLRDFLSKRLPPGGSPEDLNPERAKEAKQAEERSRSARRKKHKSSGQRDED